MRPKQLQDACNLASQLSDALCTALAQRPIRPEGPSMGDRAIAMLLDDLIGQARVIAARIFELQGPYSDSTTWDEAD